MQPPDALLEFFEMEVTKHWSVLPDLPRIAEVAQESPDVPSFIRAAFPLYRELLEGEAREIVEGKRWESGFYHSWN